MQRYGFYALVLKRDGDRHGDMWPAHFIVAPQSGEQPLRAFRQPLADGVRGAVDGAGAAALRLSSLALSGAGE